MTCLLGFRKKLMRVEKVQIVSADPFRCQMWHLHDRIGGVNEQTCKDEIASFLEHGQLLPALGCSVRGDPAFDYELIYGSRRLFVARYLKRSLIVDVRNLSDREAALALDIENRQRKDLSPYERGLCYARWLRSGLFSSQEAIVDALGVPASHVSRLLKLATLPAVIVGAFQSGLDICERWGPELADAIREPERRRVIIQRARAISASASRPPASEVYRQLLAPMRRGRRSATLRHAKVIKSGDGTPLYRIRYHRTRIAFILPGVLVSTPTLLRIRRAVTQLLDKSNSISVLTADVPGRLEVFPEVALSKHEVEPMHAACSTTPPRSGAERGLMQQEGGVGRALLHSPNRARRIGSDLERDIAVIGLASRYPETGAPSSIVEDQRCHLEQG
jgi:ParB/RepB/Spo0J family partition protein